MGVTLSKEELLALKELLDTIDLKGLGIYLNRK
jgi:hypothetical protein